MVWNNGGKKKPPSAATLHRYQRQRDRTKTDANSQAEDGHATATEKPSFFVEVKTEEDMEQEYKNAGSDSEESLPECRLQPISTIGETSARHHDCNVHGQALAQAGVPKTSGASLLYHGSTPLTSAQRAQTGDWYPAGSQFDHIQGAVDFQASGGAFPNPHNQDQSYFPNHAHETSSQMNQAPSGWKVSDNYNVHSMAEPPPGQQGTDDSSIVTFPNALPWRGRGSAIYDGGGELSGLQDWPAGQDWQQVDNAGLLTGGQAGQVGQPGTGWDALSQIQIGPVADHPTTNLDFLSLDQTGQVDQAGQAGSDPGWNRFHLHGEPGGTPGGQGNWADDLYLSLSGTGPAATIKPEHAINPLVNDPSGPFGVSDDTLLGFTYPKIPDTAFDIQDTYTGNQFGGVRPTNSSLQGQHQISNDLAIPSLRVTQYETKYEINAGPWSPFGTDALPQTYHSGPFGYGSNLHPSGARSVGVSAPPSPSLTAYSVTSCPDFFPLSGGTDVISRDSANPGSVHGEANEEPPSEGCSNLAANSSELLWVTAGNPEEFKSSATMQQVKRKVMKRYYREHPEEREKRPETRRANEKMRRNHSSSVTKPQSGRSKASRLSLHGPTNSSHDGA